MKSSIVRLGSSVGVVAVLALMLGFSAAVQSQSQPAPEARPQATPSAPQRAEPAAKPSAQPANRQPVRRPPPPAWTRPAKPEDFLKVTEPTPVTAPNPFAALAFLRGEWSGSMHEDEYVEETWSAPRGDSIIGMFRWIDGSDRTTMTEMLSIVNEDGRPTLRLRHFSSKLEPFTSEANGIAGLKLAEFTANRAVFRNDTEIGLLASCEYQSPTNNELNITVTFRDADRPPLRFNLTRGGGR